MQTGSTSSGIREESCSGRSGRTKHCVESAMACIPSPQSEPHMQGKKRKRNLDTDSLPHAEPRSKKAPCSDSLPTAPDVNWADFFGLWPPILAEQNSAMNDLRDNKRSRSLSSYSQSVRNGQAPVPWTRQHEELMQAAGLIMVDYLDRTKITKDCRQLCNNLLKKKYPLPQEKYFDSQRLRKVFEVVRFRNEARVVRDVLPVIVPSPELLSIDGCAGLDDVCEAMDAEWTQCDTLCGPRPKPDFVIGIKPSAFDKEETEKLRLSHTTASPNLFPENMYFPFLICEVKGSDRPISEAERQAMHSTSIAIRAVVELYKKVSLTGEVNQRILAFSVAHDHSEVRIFGHFAKVEDDRTTYHRYLLLLEDFANELPPRGWAKAYQAVRAIYDIFYPKHLARIKLALSRMRSPILASTSQLELDDDDSQRQSPESSRTDRQFKRPSLPLAAKLQQENEALREQLMAETRQQREEHREERLILIRQMEEKKDQKNQMERQMEDQKNQMERQMQDQKNQMERQMQDQKNQMERQLAQQKEEAREQKAIMELQLEQLREIIQLLKAK